MAKAADQNSRCRVRRSAAEARDLILEAAEKRLIEGGPEALRLQELARDLGISHPLILHHFGSREGLIGALILRWLERMHEQFRRGWPDAGGWDIARLLEGFRAQLSKRGYSRLVSW